MKDCKGKIKRRILIPYSLAILLLLAAFVLGIHWLQDNHIHREVQSSLDEVENLFRDELQENAELLSALINFIEKDENLRHAWLAKDRDMLLGYSQRLFEEIHSKFRVTHFYFHGLDRVCFLRVHKPQRYGDYIKRHTMTNAVRDKKQTWGIELGPLGTFTLRVVQPWRINGELAGYIELGEEIEHVTPQLREVINAELAFFINKSYLNRANWEEGMKMLGHPADWNRFTKSVAIDSTLDNIPDMLGEVVERHYINHNKFLFEISIGQRKYLSGFVPLIDAGGNEVGDIVVMCDVSKQEAALLILSLGLVAVCVIVGSVLFWLFYFYVGRIEQGIIEASNKKEAEIEQRKRAEKELQKARAYLDTVIEAVPEPFIVIDRQYRIVLANKASRDLAGGIDPVSEGIRCHQLSHHQDTPCEERSDTCPMKQVLDTKQLAQVIHTHYTHNGESRWVEVVVSPIFDQDGEIVQVIEACHDITERKRAEEKQGQLLEKIKSINGELKDFAYVVSHDLKAPLRGVSTITNWLAADYADKLDENGKEQLELLLSRVERMHNLIDGVLQYSRVGSRQEEKVPIELNELIPEVIDTIAPSEDIEITIENQLPEITFGRTRITQVFQNLISNAVKYMDKPQGQIKINCVEEEGFWKFSVADNGPGIEEKYFERIFKMFQTLIAKDEFESTGVGLTVVKKIVEMYGGRIWVESTLGEGSTFYFTLPKQESGVLENA
ncbi:MAG: PAS domain-containing protein [Planctomycetes bacterium]|nr:PAS domain-containing protein [Planctomycetota bacterium]